MLIEYICNEFSTLAARAPLPPALLHIICVTFAARAPLLPVHSLPVNILLASVVAQLMSAGTAVHIPQPPAAGRPALGSLLRGPPTWATLC